MKYHQLPIKSQLYRSNQDVYSVSLNHVEEGQTIISIKPSHTVFNQLSQLKYLSQITLLELPVKLQLLKR